MLPHTRSIQEKGQQKRNTIPLFLHTMNIYKTTALRKLPCAMCNLLRIVLSISTSTRKRRNCVTVLNRRRKEVLSSWNVSDLIRFHFHIIACHAFSATGASNCHYESTIVTLPDGEAIALYDVLPEASHMSIRL